MSVKKNILILAALAFFLGGCSDDNNGTQDDPAHVDPAPEDPTPEDPTPEDPTPEDPTPTDPTPEVEQPMLKMASTQGCALDADCETGAFCFNGTCTTQCDAATPCQKGFLCSEKTGRCVSIEYINKTAAQKKRDLNESSRDAVEQTEADLNESANSDVIESVIGQKDPDGNIIDAIGFLQNIDEQVLVSKGQKSVTVSFVTNNHLGDIQYAVLNSSDDKIAKLKTASPKQGEVTSGGVKIKTFTYTFDIPADKSAADNAETESRILTTSAGQFTITLKPKPNASGVYGGYVSPADILSGIDLPIRMAVKTVPEDPANFGEIQSITIYLPSSKSDLFSPESAKEDQTHWSSITVNTKTSSSQCESGKPSFVASFSQNDFQTDSKLFSAQDKINRSIRIEINDYDAATQTIHGLLVDNLTGLYRVIDPDSNGVDKMWNKASMKGTLKVQRSAVTFDEAVNTIKAHTADNEETRKLDAELKAVCNDTTIEELIQIAICDPVDDCTQEYVDGCTGTETCDETKLNACKEYLSCSGRFENYDDIADTCTDIKTVDDYNKLSAEEKLLCLQASSKAILDDDSRLSAVLTKVLSDTESNGGIPVDKACNESGKINNFADFMDACANENCGLCKERPEIECAADLIAREYLALGKDGAEEQKYEYMNTWLELMHESYLALEYTAWNKDTQIRRDWLTGAVYKDSFSAKLMNEFNDGLLNDYRENVLDAQRTVMGKQFTQTALEMLGQDLANTGNNASKLSSARNEVLAELGQTWQAVAEALALAARRHDVLTQNNSDRIAAANELRPYLFDLYFAGLIESNINIAADQGSLNGAYGANLNNIIGKLTSLDQPFEDLIFMHDGEIFDDTRIETDTNKTALGTLRDNAKTSVDKAVDKRTEVFNAQDAKILNAQQLQDSYKTSLEAMHASIVNLCGYPKDCKDKKTCKINTEQWMCGFELPSSEDGATPVVDAVSSIDEKTQKYSASINYSYDSNNSISQAALAIQEFQNAYMEYLIAQAESDALNNKADLTYAYLQSYELKINEWNELRLQLIEDIEAQVSVINQALDKIGDLEGDIENAELDAAKQSISTKSGALAAWYALKVADNATQLGAASSIAALQTTSLVQGDLADTISANIDLVYNEGNLVNSYGAITTSGASVAPLSALINSQSALRDAASAAKLAADQAAIAAELTATSASIVTSFAIESLDKNLEIALDGIQIALQEKVKKLNSQISEQQSIITAAEQAIENLKLVNENAETYSRDMEDLARQRKDYFVMCQDKLPLLHKVYLKKQSMAKALMKYYSIVQEAQLLEEQYNAKNERFQKTTNLIYAASNFFQYANDLEDVEYFIESSRNDLNKYLTAIEYLTVRPFVELRRAIYTARGTNELEKIYEQLNDLTNSCGSGPESKNQVTISLRNRMGIGDGELNGLTAADRFHYTMQTNPLPVSAQTRYTVNSSVGALLERGNYYSGTFNLSSNFANIANSCNAKIESLQIRFVSKPGTKIRESGDAAPSITLFYGGQSQLLSCHEKIDAITKSIGSRTTFGKYSTFNTDPFGDGINVSMYNVKSDENYQLTQDVQFNNVTEYNGLKGKPLMATYTILFDPNLGENNGIIWNNVADIEVQIKYTTGTLGQKSDACKYDI